VEHRLVAPPKQGQATFSVQVLDNSLRFSYISSWIRDILETQSPDLFNLTKRPIMANFSLRSIAAFVALAIIFCTISANKADAAGVLVPYDATTQASGTDFTPEVHFTVNHMPTAYGHPNGPYLPNHGDPVNNLNNSGWLWKDGGTVTIDFGTSQPITSFRAYSTYTEGARGVNILVEHSDDGSSFSSDDGGTVEYLTSFQGGVNDAGDPETGGGGFGGWYEMLFNLGKNAHQHWSLTQTGVTNSHFPRSGEIQFFAQSFTPPTVLEWAANGAGRWTDVGSWSPAGSPNSGDQTAVFGSHANITETTTAVVNEAVTVGRIEFNNATHVYAIAGTGSIDLAADSAGGFPSVDVQAGSHEFQVRTNLQADTFLKVATGQSLAFNHRLNLNGRTLTKTGDGTLAINNNLTTGTGGSLNCEGGNCSGSGTVNGALVNGSTVAPGNSPGVLTVDGDYTQGSSATLAIELVSNGGQAGTDYDRLLVWGTANLSGVLDLQVDAGYTPTIGDSMPGIVSAASVSGTFTTTNNVVFNGRQGLAVTYTETSVDAHVALRGNTDVASGDVDVDTGDLTTSIINFTSAGGSGKTWADGDMDGDGDVDTGDLTTSIINFTSALSGGANAVPEPGSLLLLVMAVGCLAVAQGRSCRS